MLFSLRPGILPKIEALRTLYKDKKIIVGRDKLDVVKGVLQKVSHSRSKAKQVSKPAIVVYNSSALSKSCLATTRSGLEMLC